MRLVTTYIPGQHRAIVWERGAMLIADDLSIPAQVSLHARLRESQSLRDAMEALSDICEASVFDVPDFAAVAVLEDDRIHVGARGKVTVSGDGTDGPFKVDGSDAAIWAEKHVRGARRVFMASAFDEGLPLVSGVVGAQGISVAMSEEGHAGLHQPAEQAEPQGTTIAAPRLDETAEKKPAPSRWPSEVPSAAVSAWSRTSTPEVTPEVEESAQAAVAQLFESYFQSRPTSVPDMPAWTSSASASSHAPAPAWDEPKTDHSVDEVSGEEAPESAALSRDRAGLLSRATSTQSAEPEREERPAASSWRSAPHAEDLSEQTMVSGIPVVAGRRFSGGGEADDSSEVADDGGFAAQRLTPLRSAASENGGQFMKAHLGMLAPAYDLDEVDSEDPEFVMAVRCATGHLIPPHARTCWSCGQAPRGEAERVHRPSLGKITVSTGQVLELTQSLIVGRDPHARLLDGQIPRLLVLPYPHVTASHVEIRLDGWQVSAKDLHSRNGTYLRRAGEPPVRVPDQPVLLESGDVLDLGQGLSLTFADIPANQ